MDQQLKKSIESIINVLKQEQSPSGAWNYPFETGIVTDCYMIILLRTLEIDDENLIKLLCERILRKQEKSGAWKLFFDEEDGNLTTTVEAYYALLYSGYYQKSDKRMRTARTFILNHGGLDQTHMLTKVMLALTGQYKWPRNFPIPVEAILLPPIFPINFYSLSVFGRVNLTPILIVADRKFSIKTQNSPDLSELSLSRQQRFFSVNEREEWRSLHGTLKQAIKNLIGLPKELHKMALSEAKQYMLNRIEPDGTFFNYFSSTFLMIFALLALGHQKDDPVVIRAVEGLKKMKTEIDGLPHMQYTTASVWNTALISYALQEAGVSLDDPAVKKANGYLLRRQHVKYGDWAVHNPGVLPGGWGFADQNTMHPDVDDTTAALRSISGKVDKDERFRQSWERGVRWTLSMQNSDGGWPAFEKNTASKVLTFLPIEKAEFLLADPSSADLTGRTLEFFGNYTNLPKNHQAIQAGVHWLTNDQRKDGSWYGRWGICYIYGTWAALTGLTSVGVLPSHRSLRKAVHWLETIQNSDGGWGESCKSDSAKQYVPLYFSTLTHTAWAVDALISVAEKPTPAIVSGIQFLIDHFDTTNWTTAYPKGQGMAGDFYIHYHSYRYLFPLLAMAHFQKKYLK